MNKSQTHNRLPEVEVVHSPHLSALILLLCMIYSGKYSQYYLKGHLCQANTSFIKPGFHILKSQFQYKPVYIDLAPALSKKFFSLSLQWLLKIDLAVTQYLT